MLKGIKNAKVAEAKDKGVLNSVFLQLQAYDNISKSTMSEEFYCVFIDLEVYTMIEIGKITGNSICTIRRHIRKFNNLIEYENSKLITEISGNH